METLESCPVAVILNSRATGIDRLVLLTMAHYAEWGSDSPGSSAYEAVIFRQTITSLATATRLSAHVCRKALANLISLGELAVDEVAAGRRPAAYRILLTL